MICTITVMAKIMTIIYTITTTYTETLMIYTITKNSRDYNHLYILQPTVIIILL